MDKTININIAGILFKIDEDAYHILRDYLQAINNCFRNTQGGAETIEDIESRIAEIFQSQKGLAGAITRRHVEEMISIIGRPDDFDRNETDAEPRTYIYQAKRMYRNPNDRIIGGVCGGIGAYLDIEPVLFRILFVIFAVTFGVGLFIYLALWIALPSAKTDTQKREMYGDACGSERLRPSYTDDYSTTHRSSKTVNNRVTGIGNAFNEIFRALGKACIIILRIFMIFMGVVLVIIGFLAIVAFLAIFIFRYPGLFSDNSFSADLTYMPDFLNYIVNPSFTPWIITLSMIALLLPTLALIYWGVKMIFWFKAKDGILSLICLVAWFIDLSALSLILFHEGINFNRIARTSTQIVMPHVPDTLYLTTGKKVADLKFNKEISFNHQRCAIFINDDQKELYIQPTLDINLSDDVSKIEVIKSSSGRDRIDAKKKIEYLQYNYRFKNDTLLLDGYFTIPEGHRWSADNIHINLNIPEGTLLKFDKPAENLILPYYEFDDKEYSSLAWKESEVKWWVMTDKGLKPVKKTFSK